jgi:hypothetical protein
MGYFIMIVMGLLLIGLGAFKYRDVSGWVLQPLALIFWQTHGF